MSKEEMLSNLVRFFYKQLQSARACKEMGCGELSNQTYQQALGVQLSAETLGISTQEFLAAYKAYSDIKNGE